jgi:hypothetical protein
MPRRMHRNANAAPAGRRRRPRRRSRPDRVSGIVTAIDPAAVTVVVRVEEARAPGVLPGHELSIDVSGGALAVHDGDGDGRAGITDLFPGDRVRVELAPEVPGAPRAATRLVQLTGGGPVGGLRRLWQGPGRD